MFRFLHLDHILSMLTMWGYKMIRIPKLRLSPIFLLVFPSPFEYISFNIKTRSLFFFKYIYRPSRVNRRNVVHYNHPFKLRKCINESFWLSIGGSSCGLWTIGNQRLPVDNQNDLFMHFLATSYNKQVVTDGCNGQGFFYWVASTIEPTIANIFFCSPTFLLNTYFWGARF